MSDNKLEDYLNSLVREATPQIMSEEETINKILARERMASVRIPIWTHYCLHRASQAVGKSKSALAAELLAAAADQAFTALQKSGHLPAVINMMEAVDYYRETTKSGEPSEPGGEIEFTYIATVDDGKEPEESLS